MDIVKWDVTVLSSLSHSEALNGHSLMVYDVVFCKRVRNYLSASRYVMVCSKS